MHVERFWEGWGQWQPGVLVPGKRAKGRDANFGEAHRLMRKLRIPAWGGKRTVEEGRGGGQRTTMLREAVYPPPGGPGAEAWVGGGVLRKIYVATGGRVSGILL